MPNFDAATSTKRESVRQANNLIELVRATYSSAKNVQVMLALYQAATDPAFNAAINALYTSAERTELGVMLNQVNALVADWEANHSAAISSG